MCRTVFLRPSELEAHAAQAQTKSAYPPYTPYIPPFAFANRNPAPPPPVEEEEDKDAFKLPPGLQIVEPSTPIDDFEVELKPDFDSIKVPGEETAELVVGNFDFDAYPSNGFESAQMSPPVFEQSDINFPGESYTFRASPPSFDEAEQGDSLARDVFSAMGGISCNSSPAPELTGVGQNHSIRSTALYVNAPQNNRKPTVSNFNSNLKHSQDQTEFLSKEEEFEFNSAAETIPEAAAVAKGKQRRGPGPRIEKWKRRDNEKHLAGERKRRANRMGKIGELKELLPVAKQKLSSIKVLVAAINHCKTILENEQTAEFKADPVKSEVKAQSVDQFTFVEGMRDSRFLSLIEVDVNQLVVHCSPAMKAFLGIEEQNSCGFHLSTIVHPGDYQEQLAVAGFMKNSSHTLQLRFACFLHNGHRVFVPSSVTVSSDGRKCILIINPLSTVYDHRGPVPLLVHK